MTELSFIIKQGKLVPEEDWSAHIKSLESIKIKTSQDILKKKLIEAIKRRLPEDKVGLMFSGGVDSTVIAFILKNMGVDPICYSVGVRSGETRESPDLEYARVVAKEFGLVLKEIILDLDMTERIIKKIIPIVGTDIVKVGVGAVMYAAMQEAKKDKIRFLFSGLGSEEIFAGYLRHAESKDINKECWNGLKIMHERDLIRDCKIAKHFNISILMPYLDKDVIIHAMQIPGSRKISKTNNKLPIRRIASDLGIPKKYAYRKKAAAQYGSNIDRAIKKLAKMKGYGYKKDYLESLLKK